MLDSCPIAINALKNQRRSLTYWSLAYAGVVAMYAGLYPFVEGMDLGAMADKLPEGLSRAMGYDQIGTASGYVSSSVFGLLGPAILSVFGVGLGSRLIAGEEEEGTLELELTGPSSRTQIYLQRFLALAMSLVGLVLVGFVTVIVVSEVADLGIAMGPMALMCVALWLFATSISSVAFAAGAATGRRAVGMGVAAALTVTSFMFNAIGPSIGRDWMTQLSPWSWYIQDSPLLGDANFVSMGLLAVLGVVAAAVGLAPFAKRDLMV
jgi:ABC-2 type transport system permease protein